MKEFGLAIVGIILGIIFKPVGEYLIGLLMFNFSGVKIRKLPIKWKTTWSFHDSGKSEEHRDVMEIKQTGPFIKGHASDGIHDYIVKARLYPSGIVHGTWKDIQQEKDWYGSFQLIVKPDGHKMIGKWVGNSLGKIRSGDWIWEKI